MKVHAVQHEQILSQIEAWVGGKSCGNYDKAKRVLSWDISTKLEDGLRQTYDWAFEQITVGKVDPDD